MNLQQSLICGALIVAAALAIGVSASGQSGVRQPAAIPPWADTRISGWDNADKAILLADMSKVEPASALAPKMKRHHWKQIPYELIGGQTGSMIWASPESQARPVSLRLGVKGWYAIFVGVFSGPEAPSNIWMKLNTDVAPVARQNSNSDYYGNLKDAFFKVAEFKGDETIEFSQQSSGYTSGGGVGYVKLIPLSANEIARLEADRSRRDTRHVTATCDGFSFMYSRRPTTKEELLSEIEEFRNTDVDTLILHSFGADKVSYPTAVGHLPGQDMDDFLVPGHRYFAEAVHELARKKINPMKVMIDGAHEMGLKVQVAVRPAGWSFVEPFTDFWETPFYKNHPNWRCEDKDGSPVTRMSWAVPEVRRHLIDLLREMVRLGADGAHIVFNRGLPVSLYEEPFRAQFHALYNLDPRTLEDTDPRILKVRSDIVTTFMRELRGMLDAEEKRRANGKHLTLSAMVLGNEFDNSWYGIDIRRLVAEGLLDEITTYHWDFGARKGGLDLKFFKEVCGPKGIPVRVGPALGLERMLTDAVSYYDQGADGIALWDAAGRDIRSWSVLSRFGRPDEMRARIKSGIPPEGYVFFRRLGSNIMNGRFSPIWGG
jgi:hypothetical protein